MTKEIVVLVPGIMGSELKDDDGLVWPGTPFELFASYDKLTRLMSDETAVGDIIRSFALVPQYSAMMASLESCGFKETGDAQSLFLFPYDWRRSNVLAAEGLAKLLDRIAESIAEPEIILIGHSMGGLVSRYLLESGAFNGRKGFARVRRLITLGTPHRGAPMALLGAVGQQKRLFLSKEQVAEIGRDPRFPSLYELLPPQGEPFIWNEEGKARLSPVDLYDGDWSAAHGVSQENLKAAKEFRAKLDLAKRPAHVSYFFFAGTEQRTVSEVRLIPIKGKPPRLRADERDNGGDGTVPVWSAVAQGVQTAPVGGEHGSIYRDAALLKVLAALLGKPGVLAAKLPQTQLSLRDAVVEPGQAVWGVLALETPSETISGELSISRVTTSSGAELAAPVPVDKKALDYRGPGADRLSVHLTAPRVPGGYRVEFITTDASQHAGALLIVQG